MISLPIGFILSCLIFAASMGTSNFLFYFNFHSLTLICGGSLAILLMSNPTDVLKNLFTETKNLFKKEYNLNNVTEDLVKLSTNRFDKLQSSEPLVAYAQDLWAQGIPQDMFVVLVSQKRKELEQKTTDAIQCLKNLSKYPSALGMVGTVMGIVSLFKNLDSNKSQIGPAFAAALTATFFGLILSNGLVMPLADRLQVRHMNHKKYLQHVYQVLLLINQNEASHLIENEVTQRAA